MSCAKQFSDKVILVGAQYKSRNSRLLLEPKAKMAVYLLVVKCFSAYLLMF